MTYCETCRSFQRLTPLFFLPIVFFGKPLSFCVFGNFPKRKRKRRGGTRMGTYTTTPLHQCHGQVVFRPSKRSLLETEKLDVRVPVSGSTRGLFHVRKSLPRGSDRDRSHRLHKSVPENRCHPCSANMLLEFAWERACDVGAVR